MILFQQFFTRLKWRGMNMICGAGHVVQMRMRLRRGVSFHGFWKTVRHPGL